MTDPQWPAPSRRDFIRTTTAAALTTGLFVPAVHAAGNDQIKVGLIGCGGRGKGAIENICEAAGTSTNIKIYALADVFEDRLKDCLENAKQAKACQGKVDVDADRCFVGFDAYQKIIDACDLIMLATPPGFRPQHLEAAVKSGRNIFTEKPVAVDPAGIRKVLKAYEEAKGKNLAIVTGTQRRHQAGYLECMKRIKDGQIGDLVAGRVFWNQNNIWANKRQDGMDDMTYQLRNWYHFTWLCGDCIVEQHVHNLDVACWALGDHPIACVGMGGQEINTAPEYGESFDHFAVDYEFPNGVHVQSMARQINNTASEVAEHLVGPRAAGTATATASAAPTPAGSGSARSTPTSRSTSTCSPASATASRSTS